MPDHDPRRQPRRGLHQRPQFLSGDDRRDPPGPHSVNIECYIFIPARSPTSSSTRLPNARDRASSSRSSRIRRQPVAVRQARRQAPRRGLPRPHVSDDQVYSLARLNNRTHRELFVIDGKTAFIGGAGVADWWAHEHKGRPHWRDTMVRVDGPAVSSIQGVFAENWLECCGEIITGDAYSRRSSRGRQLGVPRQELAVGSRDQVRVVFQSLIEGSRHTLRINTPYFLPDRQLRRACAAPGAAVSTSRSSCLDPKPISDGCASPAAASTAAC